MPDVLLLPQVSLLQSATHRSTVQKRSFNVIVAIYKQIYGNSPNVIHNHHEINHKIHVFSSISDRVHDPESNFPNPDAFLSKTPDELTKRLMQ